MRFFREPNGGGEGLGHSAVLCDDKSFGIIGCFDGSVIQFPNSFVTKIAGGDGKDLGDVSTLADPSVVESLVKGAQ